MGQGYIDYPVKDVATYLRKENVQKDFDNQFVEETKIEELSKDTKIVWSRSKGVWPVQGRDL